MAPGFGLVRFLGLAFAFAVIVAACASVAADTVDPVDPAANGTIDSTAGDVGDGVGTTTGATSSTADSRAAQTRDAITVPLSLYVVLDASGSPELSSQRTEEELTEISNLMNGIWAQADISFDVTVETISVPPDVLEALAVSRDTEPFFAQVGRTFDVENPSAINGFYLREAGNVNGFAPLGSRVFFVDDEPTVNDERVSSHEVGHLFALHHQLSDPGTLMFSGTNGTILTETEQDVARYGAQGVLNGVR